MFGRFSLGNLGVVVGSILTSIGFAAYFFTDNATLNLAGFFYGIPLLLGGLALKSSELEPVPIDPPSDATIVTLRSQQATPIQKQIFSEVTRYRYGEEAHLEVALERLGLSPSDDDRPVLTSVREENRDGAYCLILRFDSPEIPMTTWQEKQEKITCFFGPNITTEINAISPENDRLELALIAENKS